MLGRQRRAHARCLIPATCPAYNALGEARTTDRAHIRSLPSETSVPASAHELGPFPGSRVSREALIALRREPSREPPAISSFIPRQISAVKREPYPRPRSLPDTGSAAGFARRKRHILLAEETIPLCSGLGGTKQGTFVMPKRREQREEFREMDPNETSTTCREPN